MPKIDRQFPLQQRDRGNHGGQVVRVRRTAAPADLQALVRAPPDRHSLEVEVVRHDHDLARQALELALQWLRRHRQHVRHPAQFPERVEVLVRLFLERHAVDMDEIRIVGVAHDRHAAFVGGAQERRQDRARVDVHVRDVQEHDIGRVERARVGEHFGPAPAPQRLQRNALDHAGGFHEAQRIEDAQSLGGIVRDLLAENHTQAHVARPRVTCPAD
jgi:hypothetical protein